MALRPILAYPDSLLKKRAAAVSCIGADVVRLIEDMTETMYAAPGVGLAATQVGVSQRVIVLDVHDEDEAPEAPLEAHQPRDRRARGHDRMGGGLPLRAGSHGARHPRAPRPRAGVDARGAGDRGR